VGADGAGKSTVSASLTTAALPAPVKTIYMGVNLEASSLMLPTTRLLLAAKRARGGRPDLVASRLSTSPAADESSPTTDWRRSARDSARLSVWMGEEWLRQLVATAYSARGYIVIFDRHFFADYYHADIAANGRRRGLVARLHGWMLEHVYPKPGLVICLDAPSDVLYARKPEASPEWLEQRRQQYLALRDVVPTFVVIDATRPLDAVCAEVAECIRTQWKALSA
jgi:thymidylate kinase